MSLRSYWRELKKSLSESRIGFSLGLLSFEERYVFDFFGLFIPLPCLDRWHKEPEEMMDRWGFYFYEWEDLVLQWGKWHKRFHLPWSFNHHKTETLRTDGTWMKDDKQYGEPADIYGFQQWFKPGTLIGYYHYTYKLKSGEIQHRTAQVTVDRREWRRRWLKWTKRFAKVRTSIDVNFDAEVGEKTGSWKGGCTGCGWTMLPNETPEQTLRRMERERIFD